MEASQCEVAYDSWVVKSPPFATSDKDVNFNTNQIDKNANFNNK